MVSKAEKARRKALSEGDLRGAATAEVSLLTAVLEAQFGQAHVEAEQGLIMLQACSAPEQPTCISSYVLMCTRCPSVCCLTPGCNLRDRGPLDLELRQASCAQQYLCFVSQSSCMCCALSSPSLPATCMA